MNKEDKKILAQVVAGIISGISLGYFVWGGPLLSVMQRIQQW